MSILTNISGIPLFSTMQEALNWAENNGLSGYHTHSHQGQTGYMGGRTHSRATPTVTPSNAQRTTNTTRVVNTNQRTIPSSRGINRANTTSRGSRSGGY